MEVRYSPTPEDAETLATGGLRGKFLIENLFVSGQINLVYSHVDRMIIGGVVPTGEALALEAGKELAADYFAQRREIGVFNIGDQGTITVDGTDYGMAYKDMLYISRGSKQINFSSADAATPARFYVVSLPAHTEYPTTHAKISDANQAAIGSDEAASKRTIYQYIHEGGVKSCQLVMGFTQLEKGSVWNTMPSHTHERRSEVYMYFELDPDAVVFHLMGEPTETRHLVVRDGQVAISPSWSIHAGAGTQNYSFVWAMGGENQRFDDMDFVAMSDLA